MLKEGKKSSAGGTFLGPVRGEGTIFELSLVSFSHRLNIFLQYSPPPPTFFVYFALGMQKSIKTDLCSKELTVRWG